jgi:hypothetical protein
MAAATFDNLRALSNPAPPRLPLRLDAAPALAGSARSIARADAGVHLDGLDHRGGGAGGDDGEDDSGDSGEDDGENSGGGSEDGGADGEGGEGMGADGEEGGGDGAAPRAARLAAEEAAEEAAAAARLRRADDREAARARAVQAQKVPHPFTPAPLVTIWTMLDF